MKKSYMVFVIILVFSLVGCSDNRNLDRDLPNKAKIFEENYYSFFNLDISYSQYKEAIQDISVQQICNIDDWIVYIYRDEHDNLIEVRAKDLESKSSDEFKELREKMQGSHSSRFGSNVENSEISLKVSRVYDVDVTNEEWKSVYTQRIIHLHDTANTIKVTNSRYTFEKIDDDWKIIRVDRDVKACSDRYEEMFGITKEEFLNKIMKFGKVKDEKIEYIIFLKLK